MKVTKIKGTLGIAISGVQFRPNTAGSWDPGARQGHNRNDDKTGHLMSLVLAENLVLILTMPALEGVARITIIE